MTTLIPWQVSQSLYANTATQYLQKCFCKSKFNYILLTPILLISPLSRTLCVPGPIIQQLVS